MSKTSKLALITLPCGVLLAMAQTPAVEAVNNLLSWLELSGLDVRWLSPSMAVGLVLATVGILFLPTLFTLVAATFRPGAASSVHISSTNQSGGITAQTINVGAAQRKLDFQIMKQLEKNLPKGKPVRICHKIHDSESEALALELRDFLVSSGFQYAGRQAYSAEGGMGAILIADAGEFIELTVEANTTTGRRMRWTPGMAIGLE